MWWSVRGKLALSAPAAECAVQQLHLAAVCALRRTDAQKLPTGWSWRVSAAPRTPLL